MIQHPVKKFSETLFFRQYRIEGKYVMKKFSILSVVPVFIFFLQMVIMGCSDNGSTPNNNDTLKFTKSTQVFTPSLTCQIALGDLDGDGDTDAVFSNMPGTPYVSVNPFRVSGE